jgi:hypothetical protein
MLQEKDFGPSPAILTPADLSKGFESALQNVLLKKVKQQELLTITRDDLGHFSAKSPLALQGSCSQVELESAFTQFVNDVTGETQKEIIDIALKDPDHKKREHYYDKLESVFDTVRGDAQLGITILADERGILSATWTVQRPQKRLFEKLGTIFSRHKTANQIP